MNPSGSRIGIVFNGSPLFTGDAGSGESEIRRWIIENDLLECIVQLPERMFFNTGITTYIWILTNKKNSLRKNNIQLIDATSFSSSMKRNLGDKGKYINEKDIKRIFDIYKTFEENEFCKIMPIEAFGYTKLLVEQPMMIDGQLKRDKYGNIKPDPSKRDSERVPLSLDIEDYFEKEIRPHLPNAWIDRSKDKIGYEINFTKIFYKFSPPRDPQDILVELLKLDDEIEKISSEMLDQKLFE